MTNMRSSTLVSGIATFIVTLGAWANAQQASEGRPRFEAASVRLNPKQGISMHHLPPSGLVRFTDVALRRVIALAYGLDLNSAQYSLVGGREDVMSARFDIVAKPPDDSKPGQNRAMLQDLLEERFKLRLHSELRATRVYALKVLRPGQFGAQLKPAVDNCDSFIADGGTRTDAKAPRGSNGEDLCWLTHGFDEAGRGTLRLRYAGSLSALVRFVQGSVDRPIVDSTGLAGSFQWSVTFRYPSAVDADAPLIYQALEQQLGLQLVPQRAPYPVWVVDSVEWPSPN